ncbi:MAG: hypothetical protein NZM44_02935 [Candidatus Calescibacterium sp.]|nr:hypothetical protein [Candidatus Calescibacterium sp.]
MLTHYITRRASNITIITILLLFCCCHSNDKEKEFLKKKLIIRKKEYAKQYEEYQVSIFFNDNRCKILRAYFDCMNSNRTIDLNSHRINGCSKQFMVDKDTIKIAFMPTIKGENKKFKDISIVCRDEYSKLHILDTTFYYSVR